MKTTAKTVMLESIDPATDQVVGHVTVTPPDSIPEIVQHARQAQHAWSKLTPAQRADIIRPAAATLEEQAEELGELLTREMGKPLAEGVGEVRACAHGLAEELDEIIQAVAPQQLDDENSSTTLYHDPIGVVAAITPWNFPMMMPQWMVLPALITGNAVILKPSEQTPLIADAYAKILMDVLPEGVLQIVHGADDQGKVLVDSDVDLIAFTGSREVGEKIMAASAPGLKRLILELGSKDPLIILEDADIEAAAKYAARNTFRNCGQVCVSTERIYVHHKVADTFLGKLVEETRSFVVGSGMEPETIVGPMIHAEQKNHVIQQVEQAVKAGAKVSHGGHEMPGNFVEPTILTSVNHDMDIMIRETFGPIACVQTIENDRQAVDLANDTIYGLGASVFGKTSHAEQIARQLTAGMIGINKSVGGSSGSPWVGARKSGLSFHKGPMGHRQFCQVRLISTPKENS